VNCVRSLPWVREVRRKFAGTDLVVLGVHTPEFDYEKDDDHLRDAFERLEIDYPNFLDNDYTFWKRLNNRYWPTVYLVDKQGRIRGVHIGETHPGSPGARSVEQKIEALLRE
jgi:hypothetical protein